MESFCCKQSKWVSNNKHNYWLDQPTYTSGLRQLAFAICNLKSPSTCLLLRENCLAYHIFSCRLEHGYVPDIYNRGRVNVQIWAGEYSCEWKYHLFSISYQQWFHFHFTSICLCLNPKNVLTNGIKYVDYFHLFFYAYWCRKYVWKSPDCKVWMNSYT